MDKRYGKAAPSCANSLEVQRYSPRGVVAAITPWNFPVINIALKAAPILAAGNTLVAKPSEYSVGSALRMAELALEAGLPTGAMNVVTGGGGAGTQLVQHAAVDMVSFTGSTRAGLAITRAVGDSQLKPMMLECGGKSPAIVFADALESGVEPLAQALIGAALWNQGQVCVARNRLLVDALVADQLTETIAKFCAATPLGPPESEDTQFGPMATPAQLEKTLSYLELVTDESAELIVDGRGIEAPDANGCYVGPSVVANVVQDSRLVQEEIFGPVITIQPFESEAEAVQMANGTAYGLAASVWTQDLAQGHRVAAQIQAGTTTVHATPAPVEGSGMAHAAEPYGQSGFGAEGGLAALDSYSYLKSTVFSYG